VTGATTTLLANTCKASSTWTRVSATVTANAGHSVTVTLTLTSHDNPYDGYGILTRFDDIQLATSATSTGASSVTTPSSQPRNRR
jgi:serine protease